MQPILLTECNVCTIHCKCTQYTHHTELTTYTVFTEYTVRCTEYGIRATQHREHIFPFYLYVHCIVESARNSL